MKKEDKSAIIEQIKDQLGEYQHFYLTNIEGLNAEKTSELRRACFKNDIKLVVVKNKLLQKALEQKGADEALYATLKGNTALMLCNTGNAPAKLIKEWNEKDKKNPDAKPILKAAYVEEFTLVVSNLVSWLPSSRKTNSLQTLLLCCKVLQRTLYPHSNLEVLLSTEFLRLWENAQNNLQKVA